MANPILLFILFTAAAGGLLFASTIHQVPEGHVGVYWRGGALLDETTGPGFHSKLPVVTRYPTSPLSLSLTLLCLSPFSPPLWLTVS